MIDQPGTLAGSLEGGFEEIKCGQAAASPDEQPGRLTPGAVVAQAPGRQGQGLQFPDRLGSLRMKRDEPLRRRFAGRNPQPWRTVQILVQAVEVETPISPRRATLQRAMIGAAR